MTTSPSFAQMANNQSISLSSALRANTPPTKEQTTSHKFLTLSIFFLLSFFCTTHAWGADYTITFKSASSDSSSDLGTNPNVSSVVSSGTSYVASFSGCSKMYVGKSGIKLGSGSATGTMNFTLATNYQSNIKSIKVVSAKYGSDTGTLTLYSESSSLKSGISPGTDYTHTFSAPTKVTSIKLTTSAKRAYITSIVITTEEAASYTVTYNANGGSGTMSNSTGSSIKIEECTFTAPECKQFTSWNTAASGSGTSYAPNATVETNLTLYAQWENLPSYTVKLMDNDEVLTSSCNTPISLPDRNCDGYTFEGWTKTWTKEQEEWTTTAPTIIPTGSYTPTANENLYPVYKRTEETEGTPTVTTTTDKLTRALIGITGTNYTDWSGKTSNSDAVYAGNSSGGGNGKTYIQLRSDKSTAGIVTTTSGGKAKKVTVVWDSSTTSGRTLNVYGKSSAYSAASDLYNASTQGTLLGTIVCGTSTELIITEDYEYIGLRSNSGAMYLTSISIEWATTSGGGSSSTTYYHSTPECTTQTVLFLRPQPAYRHSVKNLLFCKFHHINMSKITLLVCAFACKQLTNIVSNGQPNDQCPRR